MTVPVFQIRNLHRRYGDRSVLRVRSLDVASGRFVAILGKSGSGKTTLLETLGMMSRHGPAGTTSDYESTGDIRFCPTPGSTAGVDYGELWKSEHACDELRRAHFSFMFQQSNLFNNLSVCDNIALGMVIQGHEAETARRRALLRLGELGVTDAADKADGRPNTFSGGQQQRSALARADQRTFRVFFGDEPTGNLGRRDARFVFGEIRNEIVRREPEDEARTAIIVTHAVHLALEYADEIIVIRPDGTTDAQCNLHPEDRDGIRGWIQGNGAAARWLELDDASTAVEEVMECPSSNVTGRPRTTGRELPALSRLAPPDSASERESTRTARKSRQSSETEFRHFLVRRDLGRDFSLRSINGLLLILLFGIAIVAIGIGRGGLDYLAEKMRDPFVRWVSVAIPHAQRNAVAEVIENLESKDSRLAYSIDRIDGYFAFPLLVWKKGDLDEAGGTHAAYGRTISVDDPILRKIREMIDPPGRLFERESEWGVVVTRELFTSFGYTDADNFILHPVEHAGQEWLMPLPVLGIASDLPDQADFVVTPYFYDQMFQARAFAPAHTKELEIFVPGDLERARMVHARLEAFVSDRFASADPFVGLVEAYQHTREPGHRVIASFDPRYQPPLIQIRDEGKEFCALPGNEGCQWLLQYDFSHTVPTRLYDKLSISLVDLSSVAAIKDYLFSNFRLQIDLARVKSLENYNVIASLTTFMSWCLLGISSLCSGLFVFYGLYFHLYKMRKFIGSLRAFGAAEQAIRGVYLHKVGLLILKALAVASTGALIVGSIGIVEVLATKALGFPAGEFAVNFVSLEMAVFYVLVFGVSWAGFSFASGQILNFSPGDLLYDRLDGGGIVERFILRGQQALEREDGPAQLVTDA